VFVLVVVGEGWRVVEVGEEKEKVSGVLG